MAVETGEIPPAAVVAIQFFLAKKCRSGPDYRGRAIADRKYIMALFCFGYQLVTQNFSVELTFNFIV